MLGTQVHLLVSIWFEVLIYGIAVPFFMAMAYILITKRTQNRIPSLMFGLANTGIFILGTLHVAFNLHRLVNGTDTCVGRMNPLSYIQDTVRFDSWGTIVIGSIQPIFVELCSSTRLFLIWDNNYLVIIFPGLIWLWNAGENSLTSGRAFPLTRFCAIRFNSMLLYWFKNQFTTYDKILPTVVTTLIAFKMWQNHKEEITSDLKTSSGFTLFNRIFWDSAALYTLHSLLLIPLYFESQNGQFVLQAGILPGLIICSTIMAIRGASGGASRPQFWWIPTDQVPIWLKDEKNSLHSH
ncbi:hypothetical protein FA13DRAFT_1806010 [Coprinellus micaceus]|uniref:Fungal pheromone STE3G-protein-coupled receptor n=1 Tax=Coprinellus micaceus TaxID=71717 RepID=A0A4Y7RSZ2_COPMI|nr:hypothetical protein FA13DRAFT_1806010 [Coprinellus micaceus]